MREAWCAARQAFIANPGANASLPPAMADSLYPPRCTGCQWSLAAHGAACLCASASNMSECSDLLSREFGCCNVVTVARAFELGAKWEATPAAERGVGQFIHRLRRDAA